MSKTVVIINPGTFGMDDTTEENAIVNMDQFIKDCHIDGLSFKREPEKDYGGGRYAFMVSRNGHTRTVEIQMPGRALDKVRYTGAKEQNIWHYPRLYVDGSSWVWKFAVHMSDCWEEETGSEDET